MALHTQSMGRPQGLPLEAVLASIPSYPRPVIERLVTRLIDKLDEQDAPIEDMEDDDPAGGNVEDEGEKDDPALVPHYGLDQRLMLADSGLIRWRDE